MNYRNSGSGTVTSLVPRSLGLFFKYTSGHWIHLKDYTEEEWKNKIIREMNAKRPCVYTGSDPNGGGHAFNVDGYQTSNQGFFVHVNFGWGGYKNGWYGLNSFYQFTKSHAAVFQIVDGIQVVGVSALRGLSDVKFALWMSLLSYGILALGASYLFAFVFKFGYEGIWMGYVLGLLFASIVFFKRFIKLSDNLL